MLAESQVSVADPDKPAWQIQTMSGPLRLMPFTAITDEHYKAYVTVS